MPTGSGKTGVWMGDALEAPDDEPTCIVTESRGLADQAMEDFGAAGLVDIRGASNYECPMREDYSCEEGFVARCPLKGSVSCPRTHAQIAASLSKVVITNYDKWTTSRCHGQGMDHFKRVVFDEAHASFDALCRAMQVTLHHAEIEEDLELNFLMGEECNNLHSWKTWAVEALEVCKVKFAYAAHKVEMPNPKPSWVKMFTHLRNLSRRLTILSTMRPIDWVVDELEQGFQFDPIRPGRYTEAALFFRMPKVVMMGGALRPKNIFMLGQSRDSFSFTEFESPFDPRRCPIYYIPTMKVDSHSNDFSEVWEKYDRIATMRRDRKNLVHTVSYARRDEIIRSSRYGSSMLINQKGEPPTEMMELFRASRRGTALVSPSIGAGYDFPYRDAEWAFIAKVPFLPLKGSKVLQARQQDDKEYGYHVAMQKFEQACGRHMRQPDDQGETFILDDHIWWMKKHWGHLASNSLWPRYQQIEQIPPPPRAL